MYRSLTLFLTKNIVKNDKLYYSEYTANNWTTVNTTPEGRTSTAIYNDKGRIFEEKTPGIAPIYYQYDDIGRLAKMTQGSDDNKRITQFDYHPTTGFLELLTNALDQTIHFKHDAVGRIKQMQSPGINTPLQTYIDYD